GDTVGVLYEGYVSGVSGLHLQLLLRSAGSWNDVTIDNTLTHEKPASLAFDSDCNPVVAYHGYGNRARVARLRDGSLRTVAINTSDLSGRSPIQIVRGAEGLMYVVYYAGSSNAQGIRFTTLGGF